MDCKSWTFLVHTQKRCVHWTLGMVLATTERVHAESCYRLKNMTENNINKDYLKKVGQTTQNTIVRWNNSEIKRTASNRIKIIRDSISIKEKQNENSNLKKVTLQQIQFLICVYLYSQQNNANCSYFLAKWRIT